MNNEKDQSNNEGKETGKNFTEDSFLNPAEINSRTLNRIVSSMPGIAWESYGVPDSTAERIKFFNHYIELLLGYTEEEWINIPDVWFTVIHPDDRERVRQTAIEKFAAREDYEIEFRWVAKDGHSVWVESHIVIQYDARGEPLGLRGVTVDITRRKLVEIERDQLAAQVKNQQIRLQHVFDHVPSFIVVLRGPELVYEMANPGYYQIVGNRNLIGRTVCEAMPELIEQGFIKKLQNVYRTGEPFFANETEVKLIDPNGAGSETVYLNFSYLPLHEPDGTISGILSYGIDVTEQVILRKQSEASELRYLYLFKNNPLPMWVFDLETLRFLSVNQAAINHYGYSEEEYLSMTILEIRPPEEIPVTIDHLKTDYSGANRYHIFRHQKKNGVVFSVEVRSNRIIFDDKCAELVLVTDVTERLRSDAALRKAEQNYRRLIECSPGIVYLNLPYPPYSTTYVSPNIEQIGFTSEECTLTPNFWQSILHPEDRERAISEFREAVDQNHESELKYRVIARDGSVHWWKDKARFVYDENGVKTGWQGIILDITATKELEEQLRQSQKLESVGLLAGGIAHDFNNMLTAINGYSELTLMALDKADPLRSNIEEIKKAGIRSADLTRQLLAFSRRQVLRPTICNPNEVIIDAVQMLKRVIAEDIKLTEVLEPEIGYISIDRGQFSQIIVNLIVNARDSMLNGGKLRIESNNVTLDGGKLHRSVDMPHGDYVLITVSDTGAGMDSATKERIFEPFFTTKKFGQGTGLGLATVYGIVKQSEGMIDVDSDEGVGTSFHIYLPRITIVEETNSKIKETTEMAKGKETILLVEDEELVRNLSRQILEECGYTVVEAEDGQNALDICREIGGKFDMLMTDVVMPEMDGRELAEKLQEIRPDLPILFTSGYTDDEVLRRGIIKNEHNFIQKPFTIDALTNKVRGILDRPKTIRT